MAQAGLTDGTIRVDERVEDYLADRRAARGSTTRVVPLSGDASTRRYFRLTEEDGTSVLALYPEPFEKDLPFLVVGDLLARWGLPVPSVLDRDGARGILLLEDLGERTLQDALREMEPGRRAALYREALAQLVRLQREAARKPRTGPCFEVAFDIPKLTWELHYFLKHFLEGQRARSLSVEHRAILAESFHHLCEEIASWPRVLCHRDFHSRNLMPHGGTLFWIDFQDARLGPAVYDLASLLRDSYVELPEDFINELAEEFRGNALPEDDPATFLRRFELMSVQRNLKALGTFGYMASVRNNEVYLPYVAGTLASVRRNLSRYPELDALRSVLAVHVEELA